MYLLHKYRQGLKEKAAGVSKPIFINFFKAERLIGMIKLADCRRDIFRIYMEISELTSSMSLSDRMHIKKKFSFCVKRFIYD